MRQAGVLAGPGLLALREERLRLGEDHARAKRFALALANIDGVELIREPEISMVFVRLPKAKNLVSKMAEKGIKIYPDENGVWRFVVHRWIDDTAVETFVAALASALA